MKFTLLFPLFFCVSGPAWGLELLSDNELGATHPIVSSQNASHQLKEDHSVISRQTSSGQRLFFAHRYVPECDVGEIDKKNRADIPYAQCDQKTVSVTPVKRVGVAELLANLPELPTRPIASKLGNGQVLFLDFAFDDDIALGLGQSGEILYLQDVVLTKNGKPAVIGPIKTSITTSDVSNGVSQLELNSDVALDLSLNIGAIKFAKHIDVAESATSSGSLLVGNVLANMKSKIALNPR